MTGLDPAVLDTAPFAGATLAEANAWALASRPGMEIVATSTGQIRVRVAGEGAATVVLLPDGPHTIEQLDPLVDLLVADGYRVVALEIPGFGFSWASDPSALHFDGTVAACAEALDALGHAPYVLTGVCVQAYVALALAGRRPDLCEALLLGQATDWPAEQRWADVLDPAHALREPWTGQAGWRLSREPMSVDVWYPMAAAEGFDVSAWQATAREVYRAHASSSLATLMQTWTDLDLPPITQPALVVWGDADRTHARAGSNPRGMLEHVPHAEFVTLEGVGHFCDTERPEAFAAAVRTLRAP